MAQALSELQAIGPPPGLTLELEARERPNFPRGVQRKFWLCSKQVDGPNAYEAPRFFFQSRAQS